MGSALDLINMWFVFLIGFFLFNIANKLIDGLPDNKQLDSDFVDESELFTATNKYLDSLFNLRVKIEIFDNGFVANKFNLSEELKGTSEYYDLKSIIMKIVDFLDFTASDYNESDVDFDILRYNISVSDNSSDFIKYLDILMITIGNELSYLDNVSYKLLFSEDIDSSRGIILQCTDRMYKLYDDLQRLKEQGS